MRTEAALAWTTMATAVLGVVLWAPALSHACDRSCSAGAPRDPNGCCVGAPKANVKAKPKRRSVRRADGTAGGKCYGNGTCNAGLDCADGRCVDPAAAAGVEWVRMGGGSFRMGSESGDDDEKPVRVVRVGTFALSKTEVTVRQYRACVEAAGCTAPETGGSCNWDKPGRDEHPINCVNWNQAWAFALWAGGRLPTEAEWEYAARSEGRSGEYPWGDAEANCSRAVMDEGSGNGCGHGDTTFPVCSKRAGNTAQGLCDMAGNVWEWVGDWYGPYGEAPRDGSARTSAAQYRVSRGGSWSGTAGYLRAADRRWGSPGNYDGGLGLRVARSTP